MIVKNIKYTDYNGNERTEKFYFNLSKAELTELQWTTPGGFAEYIQAIVDSDNIPEIFKIFKEVITMSFGVKSEDGKRFIKKKEMVEEFLQTEAYSELLYELTSDEQKAAEFINGIMPSELMEKNKNLSAV